MVIVFKITDANYGSRLHEILYDAFIPYRAFYTPGAFEATVVSTDIIENRIHSSDFSVYGAFLDDELAGTVTTKLTESGNLYFMTMAVAPTFSGRGVGNELLRKLEEEAGNKNCSSISLETYEPLTNGIRLYESYGYCRTGNTKDYYGITIFEMMKEI